MPRSIARGVAGVCAALMVLTGCGSEPGPRSVAPSVVPDGELCPERLLDTEAGEGLGNREPAASAPDLPAPDRAWICGYQDEGVYGGDGGLPFRWIRATDVREVTGADLRELAAAIDGFTEGSPPSACTADLGPRYAVVVRAGAQQYAVVTDMFGCGDVRLTDDLGTVAAGDPTGPGTVRGIIGAPGSYRDLMTRLGGPLTFQPPAR